MAHFHLMMTLGDGNIAADAEYEDFLECAVKFVDILEMFKGDEVDKPDVYTYMGGLLLQSDVILVDLGSLSLMIKPCNDECGIKNLYWRN